MPSLQLNGVTVRFPFTPYKCQKDYMTKVLECLKEGQNGVLESPTGTGKTLCLLCATLAWRENFRDSREEMFPNTPLTSRGVAASDGDKPLYNPDIPKIIYASRTHSQLAKVISELKNTSYRPKVCVLGSREQLCINQEVILEESHHVKVHMCRRKVFNRSCPYLNNIEGRSTDTDLVNSIPDLEDLVKFGIKHKVCPYFLTRSLMQQADVIFMPYNYLLDPKSRRAYDVELKGAVVIFDEAHNVDKMCEESRSFDLTPYDVASAISTLDRLLVEQAKEDSCDNAVYEDFDVKWLSSGLNLDIASITKIKMILLELEAAIDSFDVPRDGGITKPGIFIYELLERAHLTYETKTMIYDTLEKIISHLASQPGGFFSTKGLQKLADIIQLVFCDEPAGNHQQKQELSSAYFKVHIHRDNRSYKEKQSDVWSSSKKQGNILSYWCFSPGFSMQDLLNQQVRCIILTSGTLSPLSSVTSEMRISFPVLLENGHVINRDQLFVGVVDRGPDGVLLSSAFDRRFVPENMASLGNTVANVSRIVPHGLLVFFPSFPLMEKTLEFWRGTGHADRINHIKPMFVEPKGMGTFHQVIDGYYSKVNDPRSKGGSFFAVCRGKASEGLDFANNFGRGVVITGLPFPPKLDPRVVLKMQFLDEMCCKKAPGMKFLSGQEWYKQQAFGAVNQAIGRAIRHKDDYGAVFLCDQRFANPDTLVNLPSWVRPYVRLHTKFGNMVRDVCQFFRVAQKLRPVAIRTPAAEPPAAKCSSDASSSSYQSCFAHKAKVLDTHRLSLKRRRVGPSDSKASPDRRLDGNSGASEMATFCIDYKSEGEGGQRRPSNLLNALYRGDRCHGHNAAEETGRLSTPPLQYEKRTEVQVPGRKRKIKLIREPMLSISEDVSEEGKANGARQFLADLKKCLCNENFNKVLQALHTYHQNERMEDLMARVSFLSEDHNTHSVLRGLYPLIRTHHKMMFDEKCRELTGLGCGYKPGHSLSKEEKKAVMMPSNEKF